MAQKKKNGSSTSSKRKAPPTTAKRKAPPKRTASTAKRKTSSTAPKQTTALSTVAKVSDFAGMRSMTVTDKNISVNGKRFPNNRQNSEVAIRELEKRGVKSITYHV